MSRVPPRTEKIASLRGPALRSLSVINRESREALLGPGVGVQSRQRFWLYGGFSVGVILLVAAVRLLSGS